MSGFLCGGIGPVALKRRRAAASDWWQVAGQTCVAAYQPIGEVSLAASYVNLANPGTYDAAPGVAPTLAAGGWNFNGSTQYLETGIVAASGYSMIVRFAGANTNGVPYGFYGLTKSSSYIVPTSMTGRLYRWGMTFPEASGANVASGVMGQAGGQGYLDGVADGPLLYWAGTTPEQMYIGALRHQVTGAPTNFMATTIAAVAIYSTTLSAADVAALTTRMQALA